MRFLTLETKPGPMCGSNNLRDVGLLLSRSFLCSRVLNIRGSRGLRGLRGGAIRVFISIALMFIIFEGREGGRNQIINLEQDEMRYESYEKDIEREIDKEVIKHGVTDAVAEINRQYQALKNVVDFDSPDPLQSLRANRLSTDIAVRQDYLNNYKTREMSVKDAAVQLEMSIALNSGKNIKPDETFRGDIGFYNDYCKSFRQFIRKDFRTLSPETVKVLSVGIDPDGGYTVSPYLSERVLTRLWERDAVRQLAAVENITTNAIEFISDPNQAGATWESETALGTNQDTPDIGKVRIPVHTMSTRPLITQQLLEDSGINIESWLADKIADRFARTEGLAYILGDGVGKPRGILTYPSGTAWGQIQQVNMGAAATLTADGFIDVKYAMTEDYLEKGTWLMARSTVAAAMKLKDGMGDYIWKPSQIAADPTSSLLNLPVKMSPSMPAVAANALPVALGYWKEAYMIVDRLGLSIQRDGFTQKPLIEYYTRKRTGGGVCNYFALKLGVVHV